MQTVPEGVRYELFPESETEFLLLEKEPSLTFVQNEEGTVDTWRMGSRARMERVN